MDNLVVQGRQKALKCPHCGASLAVSVELETDYTKAKTILNSKASGSDLTNEQLASLNWKQSRKLEALCTVLVTGELLEIPIAKLLYEQLNASANKSWKLGQIKYELSSKEGTEWLQRWTPIRAGVPH
jgi:hypothetical protein